MGGCCSCGKTVAPCENLCLSGVYVSKWGLDFVVANPRVKMPLLNQTGWVTEMWNGQLTWGTERWLYGSWPHPHCHSDPCRVWWHRWGLDGAFQPHQRWTESAGSAVPCLGWLPSAGSGLMKSKVAKQEKSHQDFLFHQSSETCQSQLSWSFFSSQKFQEQF